jgi:hypothetical protein
MLPLATLIAQGNGCLRLPIKVRWRIQRHELVTEPSSSGPLKASAAGRPAPCPNISYAKGVWFS